jgi:hypothetical protein
MAVSVAYSSLVTSTEILTGNTVGTSTSAARTISHANYNTTAALTSLTTPPVTLCAYFLKTMSAGAATIDLTALVGTNDVAVDFTGLKVQIAKFKNPSTNANPITVTFGASNGYLLGGSAWKYILQPGAEIVCYTNDASPDVGGSTKTIDISGTSAQALQCTLIAG